MNFFPFFTSPAPGGQAFTVLIPHYDGPTEYTIPPVPGRKDLGRSAPSHPGPSSPALINESLPAEDPINSDLLIPDFTVGGENM